MSTTIQQPESLGTPPRQPRRAAWRLALRGLGFTLAGLALLLAGVLLLLHTAPGQEFLRQKVEHALASRMEGSAKLDRLHFALGGTLELGGLTLSDPAGTPVVRAGSVLVKPRWLTLASKHIEIDRVAVDGVQLDIQKNEDGTSNLQKLFKPQPPAAPTTAEPKRRRIEVHQLAVTGTGVVIRKADGSTTAIRDIDVDASLDATALDKTIRLAATRIAANLERRTAEGTRIALEHIATGLNVDLVHAAGTATLAPVSAHAVIERSGKPSFATDLALGGMTVALRPGEIDGTLAKVSAGLALLESVQVHGAFEGDAPHGSQQATVAGLRADARRLNEFLGRELIAADLDLTANVSGPLEALALNTRIAAPGGTLSLTGTANASKPDRPSYDLVLVGTGLAARRLLLGETIPDVEVSRIEAGVKGEGASRDQLAADVRLDVGSTRIGKITLDGVQMRGRLENGVFVIRELTVNALGQTLSGTGRYELATKGLSAHLAVDGDVGKAMAALKASGMEVKTPLPPEAVRMAQGEFAVDISGKLDEGLTVTLPSAKVRVAGGEVQLDGTLDLVRNTTEGEDKGRLLLTTIDTDISLRGLRLSSLARLRGKRLAGLDGMVSGRASVHGTKAQPEATAQFRITAGRTDVSGGPALRADLRLDADKHHANVDLSVVKTAAGAPDDELATVQARLPIFVDGANRGIARGRPVSVKLVVPRRALADLIALLPPEIAAKLSKLPPDTELEAGVDLTGTTDAPHGTFSLGAQTGLLGASSKQRVRLDGTLQPQGGRSAIASQLNVWVDGQTEPTAWAKATATLGRSPFLPGATQEVDWGLRLAVPRHALESLPLPDKARDVAGEVVFDAEIHGNRHDLAADVDLALENVRRAGKGPFAVKLHASVTGERTTVGLGLQAAGLDALLASAEIGLSGRGLLDAVRAKTVGDPSLAGKIELPRRRIADWKALAPKLEEVLGELGGELRLGGTIKEPTVEGGVELNGVQTIDGHDGHATVELRADHDRVSARVELGASGAGPVALAVDAPRSELLELLRSKQGERAAALQIQARADKVPLESVVPKMTRSFPELAVTGMLDWAMDGTVQLASRDGVRSVQDAALTGTMQVQNGAFVIPHTNRRYHGMTLRITSTREALVLNTLQVAERDREKENRTIALQGRVDWHNLKPQHVALQMTAADWLVFGGDLMGRPDAPRATLSANLEVAADLTGPRRRVDTWVRSLALRMPDRFDKATWPERTSLGDVIFLDETTAPGGQLPVPESKRAVAIAQPAPEPAAPEAKSGGTDIVVHIPKPIRLQKPPFEFIVVGEVGVTLNAGAPKPAVAGVLTIVDGSLALGGRKQTVDPAHTSTITFDAEHPAGALDLYLHYTPHPVVLQDMSGASAGGSEERLHLVGAIAKPVSTVEGVGNADLWDMLPTYNAGRVKFTSQPDMPATQTVQFPRDNDVIMLSYMAVNMPHNLFLNRINVWADPYDDRMSYGRLRHLEADRYTEDGKVRIRATARPPTVGQSGAEIEADYLRHNGPRTKAGAGVTAGSRLGGGPVLFWEWSSDD